MSTKTSVRDERKHVHEIQFARFDGSTAIVALHFVPSHVLNTQHPFLAAARRARFRAGLEDALVALIIHTLQLVINALYQALSFLN